MPPEENKAPETKVEAPETKDVTPKEPQADEEEVQKGNGNKNLRKALIEANIKLAQYEKGNSKKSELPKSALDILRNFSTDDDTAMQLAEALRLISRAEGESLLTEKESLTKAEKAELARQELETEQIIDDIIEDYRADGIKITARELNQKLQEEFGNDDSDYVTIPDERSIKLVAKMLVKEKKEAIANDANQRKDAISNTSAPTNRGNSTATKHVIRIGRY